MATETDGYGCPHYTHILNELTETQRHFEVSGTIVRKWKAPIASISNSSNALSNSLSNTKHRSNSTIDKPSSRSSLKPLSRSKSATAISHTQPVPTHHALPSLPNPVLWTDSSFSSHDKPKPATSCPAVNSGAPDPIPTSYRSEGLDNTSQTTNISMEMDQHLDNVISADLNSSAVLVDVHTPKYQPSNA